MSQPIAYGIDFGTSNSSIAVAYRRSVAPLGDLTDPGVKSLLYLDSSRLKLVGDEAVRQYLVGVDRTKSRLMSSLKSELATPARLAQSTRSWGETWSLEGLTGLILRDLKRRADERLGADVKRAVIGYPVVFAGVEDAEDHSEAETLQELALMRLEKAARSAGFKEVEFLDEPTAALKHHDDLVPGINVALDFGAGTFDVSVIRYRSRPRETLVLAKEGIAIGGDRFDCAVFNLKLHKRLGFEDLRYGDPIAGACTTAGMLHLVRDANARHRLAEHVSNNSQSGLRILKRVLDNGQAHVLSNAVEEAKHQLSTATTATVELFRPDQGININEEVGRADFEEAISDDLSRVSETIGKALEEAQITSGDIGQVVLTGGSCKIPAFWRRVHSKFRSSRFSDANVASRVALGLASEARRLFS